MKQYGAVKTLKIKGGIIVGILLILLCLGVAQAEGKPEITLQPKDMTVDCMQTFSLDVRAEGSDLNYQWYLRKKGESDWTRWKNMNSATVYTIAAADLEGAQVRCVVSNAEGSVTSRAADITIAPSMNGYTVECQGEVGEKKTLQVTAYGPGLTYQWYYRMAGIGTWVEWPGQTTNACTFVLEQRHDGMQFDCRITASNGLAISTYSGKSWSSNMTVRIKASETPFPTSEITLYYLEDDYVQYITIPDDLLRKYDLSGHALRIISGESVDIDEGVIAPKATVMYGHQLESGSWVFATAPSGQPGEITRLEYSSGDTVIRVDGERDLIVHVNSYATQYANDLMDDYLEKNVQDDMTEYQKAEKCCQFVAGYSYGVDHASAEGMIITGSGDCWASVDTLMYMLKRIGINAVSRYAGYKNGAGSGHYNVLAALDGLDYILEAGYVGQAPRDYTLTLRASPFVYGKNADGGVTISDFIDIHNTAEIRIPDSIEGLPVTKIGERAFQYNHAITHIVLPKYLKTIEEGAFLQVVNLQEIDFVSELTSIGPYAFCDCEYLTEVKIPASVTRMDGTAFWDCTRLQRIDVDAQNANYRSVDGVLFTHDMQTLLAYPPAKTGSYEVPEGVVTIPGEAFAHCGIDVLTLPATLRVLEARSFYCARINRVNFSEGMTAIPAYCFNQSRIMEVNLPEKLKRIEDYAFFEGDTQVVLLPEGLEYIGEGAFAGNNFLRRIIIPASVQTIAPYAFALNYGWSSYGNSSKKTMDGYIAFREGCACEIGESAFSNALLGVYPGSTAHTYAQANDVPFVLVGDNELKDEWFEAISSNCEITDAPVVPTIEPVWNAAPCKLKEGCDYRVDYTNNTAPGTGVATITGIGAFTGTVVRTFDITRFSYLVLFDPCGGEWVKSDRVSSCCVNDRWYGYIFVHYNLPFGALPTPYRYGFRFQGWFTEPEGGEQVTEETLALSKNADKIILYAHWRVADENGDGVYTVEDDFIDRLGIVPKRVYRLPASTTIIDAEAFVNTGVQVVYIPESIAYIDSDAFDDDVLLVLPNDSLANWAKSHGLNYIVDH